LQYANDTLIFLQANAKMVENLKWLFIVFEGIFGVKVNFAKSKLIPLNITNVQTHHFSIFWVVNWKNCHSNIWIFLCIGKHHLEQFGWIG
jgi:hypothetical protein